MTKHIRKEKNCEVCGKSFVSWNPNPRFCSLTCFGKYQEAPLDLAEAIRLYEAGHSQDEVAMAMGTSQKVISGAFRRAGYTCRARIPRDQRGPKGHTWKGGTIITRYGYRMVLRPDHPRAHRTGYVMEHILVAEQKLGRPLHWDRNNRSACEIVHHINGNKTDNRPENIAVVTPREHLRIHRSKPFPRKYCIACGTLLVPKQEPHRLESLYAFARRQHCDLRCMGVTQQRRNAQRRQDRLSGKEELPNDVATSTVSL